MSMKVIVCGSIDYYTGQLSVNGDYDVDNDNMPTNRTLLVQTMDKGGLTDNTSVTLNFKVGVLVCVLSGGYMSECV